MITKHSTSHHFHGSEDSDAGFRRFINIFDFKGHILVENKLISSVDCKTFLLQKIWHHVNQNLYYFVVNTVEGSTKTTQLQLFQFDISQKLETITEEYDYAPEKVNIIGRDAHLPPVLPTEVLCAIFVHNRTDNYDLPIQKQHVALLHKHVKEEDGYYATIREISNINKVIFSFNLVNLDGNFNLSFFAYLNSNGEYVFHYEVRKGRKEHDIHYFFKALSTVTPRGNRQEVHWMKYTETDLANNLCEFGKEKIDLI